jgi:ribosomal protein S18 acetylase RimI-like enzyme
MFLSRCWIRIRFGSYVFELKHGTGYISRFGVKLAAQSCGIGHALIQAVVDDCRASSIPAIALHTSSKMSSLIRFNYGHGFYIRMTSTDRGYVRALLIKELQSDYEPDLEALKP